MKKTSADCEEICRRIPIELKDCEKLADHLLANGVVVLPCKVGDTVYYIGGIHHNLVKSAIVEEIIMNSNGVSDLLVASENNITFENSIDIFYFTKEQAEAKLKEGKG
jgi:hypothetical protein